MRAAIAGSVLGGIAGALFLGSLAPGHLRLVGVLGGGASTAQSVLAWLAICLGLGITFAFIAPQTIDQYARNVQGLTRRSSATLIGGAFGLGGGVLVGAILVPALVNGLTAYEPSVPLVNVAVVLGYTVTGLVLGATYDVSLDVVGTSSGFQPTRGRATAFGGLFGAFVGGLVLQHLAGLVYMRWVGSIGGKGGSVLGSWVVWTVLALALAAVFAYVVDGRFEVYAERAERMGGTFERSPRTAAGLFVGLGYGLAVAVLVGMLVVPLLVNASTPFRMALPTVNGGVFLAFVAYGAVLGAGYGAVLE